MIVKPWELAEAELILGCAERFGVAPHEVYRWPARTLRLLRIEALGKPKDKPGDGKGGDAPGWPT